MRSASLKPAASVVQEDRSGYYPEMTLLHDRMPVVLDYDHYDLWLNRGTPDIADLNELLLPYSAQGNVYPVSLPADRAGMDEPELLKSVGDAQA